MMNWILLLSRSKQLVIQDPWLSHTISFPVCTVLCHVPGLWKCMCLYRMWTDLPGKHGHSCIGCNFNNLLLAFLNPILAMFMIISNWRLQPPTLHPVHGYGALLIFIEPVLMCSSLGGSQGYFHIGYSCHFQSKSKNTPSSLSNPSVVHSHITSEVSAGRLLVPVPWFILDQ